MKITVVFAKIRLPKIWLSCATSLSTYSNSRKPLKVVSMPSNYKPPGIKIISSKSSPQAIKMRLP